MHTHLVRIFVLLLCVSTSPLLFAPPKKSENFFTKMIGGKKESKQSSRDSCSPREGEKAEPFKHTNIPTISYLSPRTDLPKPAPLPPTTPSASISVEADYVSSPPDTSLDHNPRVSQEEIHTDPTALPCDYILADDQIASSLVRSWQKLACLRDMCVALKIALDTQKEAIQEYITNQDAMMEMIIDGNCRDMRSLTDRIDSLARESHQKDTVIAALVQRVEALEHAARKNAQKKISTSCTLIKPLLPTTIQLRSAACAYIYIAHACTAHHRMSA